MTEAFFIYYEQLGQFSGPLLRPLETPFAPTLPPELIETRRYRGQNQRIVDTLFYAIWPAGAAAWPTNPGLTCVYLTRWPEAAPPYLRPWFGRAGRRHWSVTPGRHHHRRLYRTIHARSQNFLPGQRGALAQNRRRWSFTLAKRPPTVLLTHGDTRQAQSLLTGFKPHLLVTDLPYGIQHQGELVTLLTEALPVWTALLPPEGAIAWAWDSTRFPVPK